MSPREDISGQIRARKSLGVGKSNTFNPCPGRKPYLERTLALCHHPHGHMTAVYFTHETHFLLLYMLIPLQHGDQVLL